jgi:hypothetical protein
MAVRLNSCSLRSLRSGFVGRTGFFSSYSSVARLATHLLRLRRRSPVVFGRQRAGRLVARRSRVISVYRAALVGPRRADSCNSLVQLRPGNDYGPRLPRRVNLSIYAVVDCIRTPSVVYRVSDSLIGDRSLPMLGPSLSTRSLFFNRLQLLPSLHPSYCLMVGPRRIYGSHPLWPAYMPP